MPKGRGRRSAKTSPYTKTRPVDPVSRSKASSSSISDSPKRASGKDDVIKIVNYKELSGINQNLEPDEEGNMKLTNTQADKWDFAAKIQSQVIERDVELRCSDGIVIADQSVLAAVSNFLKEIFNAESVVLSGAAKWPENATGPARSGMIADRRKADLVTLLVPDIDCETMYGILACFYWGFIPLSSTTNEKITEKVQLIKVAWNLLHIDVVISKLEPVDSQLDLPSKQETRLVKNVGRKASTALANFRVKQEGEDQRLRRQSSRTTSYADMDEDDPDDPTPLANIEKSNTSAKVKPENNYTYSMMAIHECVICKGKTPEGKPDKEAMNLTFKDKTTVRKVREHYGKCFYNAGKIFPHVDPEEENADANGKVIDEFGKRYKYQCKVKGCWKQRKDCGYKELAMHNAIEHGILEKILEDETEEKYVVLLKQIKAADEREYLKAKPLKCRIRGCPDGDINFENDQDYFKLQTHYASQHYRAWFVNKDDGGKVRNQKVVEPGRGTVCRNCKDRVYGNEDNMMGHYATKHARLADAVLEGQSGISDVDGRAILVDLYPDRVGEFDRSRK